MKANANHKLRQATVPSGCGAQAAPDANGVPLQTVTCQGQSMAAFVDLMQRGMPSYF